MLRKTRIFVIIFFVFSVLVFSGYRFTSVIAEDRTIPVIKMDSESITVSVEGGDDAILEGVTAIDEKDGDITENIFIESRSNFIEKGRYNVTLAVSDKDNHVTKATREVIYSDYKSPQFSLSKPLKFLTARENQDDLNIASGLSATDVVDGNISNQIKISSDYSINTYTPGEYPMEFVVTNSMGDTAKLPVIITIYSAAQESGLPKVILSNYLINTPVGTEVDFSSIIEQIDYHNATYRKSEDGNFYSGEYDLSGNAIMISSESVQIEENIDWNTPGVYEVKVTVTDATAEISNYARCYVVVY